MEHPSALPGHGEVGTSDNVPTGMAGATPTDGDIMAPQPSQAQIPPLRPQSQSPAGSTSSLSETYSPFDPANIRTWMRYDMCDYLRGKFSEDNKENCNFFNFLKGNLDGKRWQ